GVVRALVDVGHAAQRAGPGDAAVAGVEDADLGFLVRRHRRHHLHADALPIGPAVAEIVFDHPLDEALADHRRAVVPPGGRFHALAHVGCGARRDAIDHRVGAADVRVDPGAQRTVADLLDELNQTGAHLVAVVAQVVAV